MASTLIRPDVEGDLVRFADSASGHFGKRLSMNVAWQVFDPCDLQNLSGSVVERVIPNGAEGVYELHYQAGVEPSDLDSLRDFLRPTEPLGPWRLSRLARDLCEQLQALHVENIPQMLVHPERVGRLAGKFVLLPTLAGILPPLSQVKGNMVAGWLHYIAPEVLRTRGLEKSLLAAGDVYSLGALLQALCVPQWDPLDYVDALALAELRVEGTGPDKPARVPAGFETLQTLLTRMMSPLPDDRPTLAAVAVCLSGLLKDCDPESQFRLALTQGQLDQAGTILTALEKTQKARAFDYSLKALHLMNADWQLAQTPPDCPRALEYLHRAGAKGSPDVELLRRVGRAYARWTAHPQRVQASVDAHGEAAELSGFAADVTDEWVEALRHLEDITEVLRLTLRVPARLQSRNLVALRADCWLRLSSPRSAWQELTAYFPRVPFDAALYEYALAVAEKMAEAGDATDLMRWFYDNRDRKGIAGALSICWKVNGNEANAARFLQEARAYSP